MAWTTPADYSTGQVITATIWNNMLGATGNSIETAGGKVTTAGDLVYGTGANAVSRLGIGSANEVLKTNSGATAPEWSSVATTELTTGANKVYYGSNASAVTELSIGSNGTVLTSQGATSAPAFAAQSIASSAITGWGNDKVLYTNGSGGLTELALGASGEFLKSNGATSAPTFATPPGGGTNGLELVASSTTENSTTNTTSTNITTLTWSSISKPILVIGRARFSGHSQGYIDFKPTHSGGSPTLQNSSYPGILLNCNGSAGQTGGSFIAIMWPNLPSGNDTNYQVPGTDFWSNSSRDPGASWSTVGASEFNPAPQLINDLNSNAIQGCIITGYADSGTTYVGDVYVYSFATS